MKSHNHVIAILLGLLLGCGAADEPPPDRQAVGAPPEWLPPFSTGYPQGLAIDAGGTLYYADLDLTWQGSMPGPGPNGSIRRIRFDGDGEPLPPETLLDGLAFPDAVSVLRSHPER